MRPGARFLVGLALALAGGSGAAPAGAPALPSARAAVGPDAGHAAKPARCGRGALAIRVGRKRACLPRKRLRRSPGVAEAASARAALARGLASRSFLAEALGRRGLRRVRRALPAARRLALRRARALPAAAQGVVRPAPPGQVGGAVETGGTTTGAGGIEITLSASDEVLVDECPGAGGALPGTVASRMTLTFTGPLEGPGRRRFVARAQISIRAAIAARVGEDARVRDFDLDAAVDYSARVQVLGPAGLEHQGTTPPFGLGGRLESRELPVTGVVDPLKAPHLRRLDLVDRGPVDVEVSRDRVAELSRSAGRSLADAIFLAYVRAQGTLPKAEAVFRDDAACLSARFAPSAPAFAEGTTTPVSVTVHDRAGGRVETDLAVTATGATATPAGARTTEAAAATFQIAPSGDTVRLLVDGTSPRGRVAGRLDAPVARGSRVFMYRVEATGVASFSTRSRQDFPEDAYVQTETAGGPIDFTTTWNRVIVPADGAPPATGFEVGDFGANAHAIAGPFTAGGVRQDTGREAVTWDCRDGRLAVPNPFEHRFTVASAGPAAYALGIRVFDTIQADGVSGSCTGDEGAGPGRPVTGLGDLGDAGVGTVTLAPAELDRDRFTVSLTGPAAPLACASPCVRRDLDWSATVTFRRLGTCRRVAGGYACPPYDPTLR